MRENKSLPAWSPAVLNETCKIPEKYPFRLEVIINFRVPDIRSLPKHADFLLRTQDNLQIKTNRKASIIRKRILKSFDAAVNDETNHSAHKGNTDKSNYIRPEHKHIIPP